MSEIISFFPCKPLIFWWKTENPFVFKKLAISGPGQLSISSHNSKIKQSKLFLLKETTNPFFFEANASGNSDISFNSL